MRNRHRIAMPLLAAMILGLTVALPAWAQDTFEQIGIVRAVSPLQQRLTLLVEENDQEVERIYALPADVYRAARDSDDHPVTLKPGQLIGISGTHHGGTPVIDNIRVHGMADAL